MFNRVTATRSLDEHPLRTDGDRKVSRLFLFSNNFVIKLYDCGYVETCLMRFWAQDQFFDSPQVGPLPIAPSQNTANPLTGW